jgi:hypothetical protein
MKSPSSRIALLVLAALAVGWMLTGCGTIESDNEASSPWNKQAGWQQSPINPNQQYQR